MKRARITLILPMVVAGIGAVAALVSWPAASAEPTAAATPKASPELIARGDYLATTSGCKDCHTPGFFYGAPDASRELSGSEIGWSGPWGVTYPPNLTPDVETGIGAWTDQQIVAAIRNGVRPDKTVLRPPMPWQNFGRMTDADVNAIVAYLRNLKPVRHVEPNALPPGSVPTGAFFQLPAAPTWDAPGKARAAEEHDQPKP